MELILQKILAMMMTTLTLMSGMVASNDRLGIAIPQSIANFQTSLASGIGKTDTSITLVNGNDPTGTAISGYMCFTLDANTANSEFVCGTASSTAVSSVTRGVSPVNPSATSSILLKTHGRGASVVLTNYPSITILSRILNGQDTIPAKLSYDSSITTSTITQAQNLVSKAYVDGIVIAGGVVADTSTAGISILATQTQTASGTATSGAYSLIPQNRYFNVTSSATTTVPVTNTSGKLSTGFIDQTGTYDWSGAHTFASSTTFNGITNVAPVGSITMYASTTAPVGWLIANGSAVSTSTYSNLFSLLGYSYGGSTSTFNLPDLRGRGPMGLSTTTPFNSLGNTGGEKSHVQTLAELATHSHDIKQFSNSPSTQPTFNAGSTGATVTTATTESAGSSTAFNVLDPYLTVNFIIKY